MTNREIFTQILSEATGKPKKEVEHLTLALTKHIGIGRLDEERPQGQGEKLLEQLRRELPGIRAWLEQGRREAAIMIGAQARNNN